MSLSGQSFWTDLFARRIGLCPEMPRHDAAQRCVVAQNALIKSGYKEIERKEGKAEKRKEKHYGKIIIYI